MDKHVRRKTCVGSRVFSSSVRCISYSIWGWQLSRIHTVCVGFPRRRRERSPPTNTKSQYSGGRRRTASACAFAPLR